jgi:acetyl esterase
MPLDPQAQQLLEQLASTGAPPLHTLSPVEAREATAVMFRVPPEKEEPVARIENRTIPGPAGAIPVRIYTPAGNGPFPVLVYIHGGGWVICDLDTHDAACRSLTNQAGCVTVSVDYRLAPEHKFPAAVEDSYAATLWAAEHARELNGDPGRIAVGGDSAGGNLAAAVALMARDSGKPNLCFQLLVYPAVDGSLATESMRAFKDYFLTPELVSYFWNHYVRSDADRKNPLASPTLAGNFRGLAPALIITAEFDPLRDEGEAYGEKLRAAGVPVAITRYNGMIHGFFTMADVLDQGKQAVAESAAALKKAFNR